jgi:hypothetical protein
MRSTNQGRRGNLCSIMSVALGLAALPGCLSCHTKCPPLAPACAEACAATPACTRGNVYVFVVNGFDPFDLTKVGGMRAAFSRLGFNKVYTGQFYHAGEFAEEMRALAATEPDARFVVVGVGAGVDAAMSLADTVAGDGVTIDLVASVDSPFWSDAPTRHPGNVRQVMALHGQPTWIGVTPSVGDDFTLPRDSWGGVSGHPLTVETLAGELAAIASSVPVAPVAAEPAVTDETPAPRPFTARVNRLHDGWDFLFPANRLGDDGAVQAAADSKPAN